MDDKNILEKVIDYYKYFLEFDDSDSLEENYKKSYLDLFSSYDEYLKYNTINYVLNALKIRGEMLDDKQFVVLCLDLEIDPLLLDKYDKRLNEIFNTV